MHIRSLIVWLALSASATAEPPVYAPNDAILFLEMGFTYCDAELMAERWGLASPWDAKIRAGRHLHNDRGHNRVAGYVHETRKWGGANGKYCSPWSMNIEGYGIDALAQHWGVSNTEAKVKINDVFLSGHSGLLWRVIENATYKGDDKFIDKGSYGFEDERGTLPLDDTRFTLCDADRMADVWNISTVQAQERLITKAALLSPEEQVASIDAIRPLTPHIRCDYYPEFSYDDVTRIAAWWNVDRIDVKTKLNAQLTNGTALGALVKVGRRPNHLMDADRSTTGTPLFHQNDELTAFAASHYTQCDARLIATSWSLTHLAAKTRLGRMIIDGDGAEIALAREDAGRLAVASNITCIFGDDYTTADAETMAAHWGTSASDAREQAVYKLMHGASQEYLHEALWGR